MVQEEENKRSYSHEGYVNEESDSRSRSLSQVDSEIEYGSDLEDEMF
jgi:hypothetical protein